MNILIIGSGGIGAYYGARLQSAGHRVTYLARGEQLATLQRDGLSVHHPDFTFADRVDAEIEAGFEASTLAALGDRASGSESERAAFDRLEGAFSRAGIEFRRSAPSALVPLSKTTL